MKFGLYFKGEDERISLYETSNSNLNSTEKYLVAYNVFRVKKNLRESPFNNLFDVRVIND